ncbi:cellulose binding domain-containing protein [Streptosporangium sp. CA-115845]|uniref:cellulose binding domain-containing protein n=1 Tax=Streptosporangium sp. CA-115845 TaxID=3240071 RepID=UPI003D8BA659
MWMVPSGVTLAWNFTITPSGATWTIKAPSWVIGLASGASATFGFQANGPSTPSDITCSWRAGGMRLIVTEELQDSHDSFG